MLFEGFCDIFSRWNEFINLYVKISDALAIIEKDHDLIAEKDRLDKNKETFETEFEKQIDFFNKDVYQKLIPDILDEFFNYNKSIILMVKFIL